MQCSRCSYEVQFYERHCPVCQNDVGFPNVRAAVEERAALHVRYEDSLASARVKDTETQLLEFSTALAGSNAVLCRGIRAVVFLMESDKKLMTSFYSEIAQASRIAEDNVWDRGRDSVDGMLFPLYKEEIIFAALSLTGAGVGSYGSCHLTLLNDMIQERASVFHENPFAFCKRHLLVAGQDIPKGYRATWSERHLICVAKLHERIGRGTRSEDFQDILLNDRSADPDWVEVHIFGSVHRRAVKRIKVVGLSGSDRVLVRSLQRSANALGIPVDIT